MQSRYTCTVAVKKETHPGFYIQAYPVISKKVSTGCSASNLDFRNIKRKILDIYDKKWPGGAKAEKVKIVEKPRNSHRRFALVR